MIDGVTWFFEILACQRKRDAGTLEADNNGAVVKPLILFEQISAFWGTLGLFVGIYLSAPAYFAVHAWEVTLLYGLVQSY